MSTTIHPSTTWVSCTCLCVASYSAATTTSHLHTLGFVVQSRSLTLLKLFVNFAADFMSLIMRRRFEYQVGRGIENVDISNCYTHVGRIFATDLKI